MEISGLNLILFLCLTMQAADNTTNKNLATNHAEALEAILFVLGRPVSRVEIMLELDISSEELHLAVEALEAGCLALQIVDDGTHLELRTKSTQTQLIQKVLGDESSKEIGRAGMEVLACILYKKTTSRAEIDFIRGVSSAQTIRTLLMRGLIKKSESVNKVLKYEVTTDLLGELGVVHVSEIPEYETIQKTLEKLQNEYASAQEA